VRSLCFCLLVFVGCSSAAHDEPGASSGKGSGSGSTGGGSSSAGGAGGSVPDPECTVESLDPADLCDVPPCRVERADRAICNYEIFYPRIARAADGTFFGSVRLGTSTWGFAPVLFRAPSGGAASIEFLDAAEAEPVEGDESPSYFVLGQDGLVRWSAEPGLDPGELVPGVPVGDWELLQADAYGSDRALAIRSRVEFPYPSTFGFQTGGEWSWLAPGLRSYADIGFTRSTTGEPLVLAYPDSLRLFSALTPESFLINAMTLWSANAPSISWTDDGRPIVAGSSAAGLLYFLPTADGNAEQELLIEREPDPEYGPGCDHSTCTGSCTVAGSWLGAVELLRDQHGLLEVHVEGAGTWDIVVDTVCDNYGCGCRETRLSDAFVISLVVRRVDTSGPSMLLREVARVPVSNSGGFTSLALGAERIGVLMTGPAPGAYTLGSSVLLQFFEVDLTAIPE